MNKEKLPIKYHIGIWKSLSKYPTDEDVLYELYVFLSKKKSDEFSELTFNGIWHDQDGVANWKDTPHETVLNRFLIDGTFYHIQDERNKKWYTIKNKLPWMD